jgi:hypothetical protein
MRRAHVPSANAKKSARRGYYTIAVLSMMKETKTWQEVNRRQRRSGNAGLRVALLRNSRGGFACARFGGYQHYLPTPRTAGLPPANP